MTSLEVGREEGEEELEETEARRALEALICSMTDGGRVFFGLGSTSVLFADEEAALRADDVTDEEEVDREELLKTRFFSRGALEEVAVFEEEGVEEEEEGAATVRTGTRTLFSFSLLTGKRLLVVVDDIL
jgi:hypothetical protein